MAADQKRDRFAITGFKTKTLHAVRCHLQARNDMVVSRNTLAHVVQQQSQVQQLRPFQFLEKAPISLVPLRIRLPRTVQAFDREERMLVYSETVVKIADYERVNQLHLRKQQCKQPQRMHGPKRFGSMWLNQHGL